MTRHYIFEDTIGFKKVGPGILVRVKVPGLKMGWVDENGQKHWIISTYNNTTYGCLTFGH